jgi:hypothetical protein
MLIFPLGFLVFVLSIYAHPTCALPVRNILSLIKGSSADSVGSIAPIPRTKRKKGLFSENSLFQRLAREAKTVFSSDLEKLTLQVFSLLFFVMSVI